MKKTIFTLRTTLMGLCMLLGSIIQVSAQSGKLDPSFDPGKGFLNMFDGSGEVQALIVQPDGKIIVSGYYASFDGTARKGIARLNPDGKLDAKFDPGKGFEDGASDPRVYALALQPDGKIIVGGQFKTFNGDPYRSIARLNSDGSIDKTFDPGTGFTKGGGGAVMALALQPDGKIIVGGNFNNFNGNSSTCLARLNSDGSLDKSFDLGTGFQNSNANTLKITELALQPDGKILVGGEFFKYNGASCKSIVRLEADGKMDAGFDMGTGFDNGFTHARIQAITLQPDGKIIVGGYYNDYNGAKLSSIVRLDKDGSLDKSFDAGKGFTIDDGFGNIDMGEIFALALQPDGKIITGGSYTDFDGTARQNITRLNDDGSIDATFDPGKGFEKDYGSKVNALALQADGKVIAGGAFTTFDGTGREAIARLNAYIQPLAIISLSPAPDYCAGSKVDIAFTAGATFNQGNTFIAQLSDASGSFAKPVDIGKLSGTASGTINAIIPSNTPLGKGYRIRLVSDDPAMTGHDNGTDISITGAPVVVANASAKTVCKGEQVTLTGSGASTYTWDNGVTDGVAFTPSSTTTYTVTGSTGDCSSTDKVTITVNLVPDVQAIASDDTVCSNEMVTLNGKGADDYQWDNNVKDDVAFFPGKTTTYTLVGTTKGCSDTAKLTVTVNDTTATTYLTKTACDSFTLNEVTYTKSGSYTQEFVNAAGCDSIFVLDLTVHTVDASVQQTDRTLTATEQGATYQWIDCDTHEPVIGANKQSFTSNVDGNYAVVVTANDCTDTSDCFAVKSTGLNDVSFGKISVKIYPNPARNMIYIDAPYDVDITLAGMDGRILLHQSSAQSVNIERLDAGIYMIYAKDKAGRLVEVKKVTKIAD